MTSSASLPMAHLLRAEVEAAHRLLEATMAGVDNDLGDRAVPGRANRIGATYAHAVLAEDATIHGLLQGQTPLYSRDWAGRTGTDRPVVISSMPFPGTEPGDLEAWYRGVHVDLSACRAYAQAVYARTTAFLETVDETSLARPMDMSGFGMGMVPRAVVVAVFVTGHLNNMAGEIAALKGMFGHKGYPY